jgi:hypothetical protein
LTPNWVSNPSTVSLRGTAITPALLQSTWSSSWVSAKSAAKRPTDERSARSSSITVSEVSGAFFRMRSPASTPRSTLRHARTTFAPWSANSRAAS